MMNLWKSFIYLAVVGVLLSSCKKDNGTEPKADQPKVYYVDSAAGDDANDGRSAESPWKSLEKVNATVLKPGESLLYKAGSIYNGQLKPLCSRCERQC